MVACPNCRIENLEGALRCKNCGMPLVKPLESYQQPIAQSPQPEYPVAQSQIQKSEKGKVAFVGGIMLIIASSVGLVGTFLNASSGHFYYFSDQGASLEFYCLILFPLSIVGSAFAIARRYWIVSFLLSIPAVIAGILLIIASYWGMISGPLAFVLGLIGLIFIAVSRKEFKSKRRTNMNIPT